MTTDNRGGEEVARHLIEQGYKSFGYIAGWEGHQHKETEKPVLFGIS